MQFKNILVASLATIGLASANSIIFVSRDDQPRYICYYSAPDHDTPAPTLVPGKATIHVPIPLGYEGAFQTASSPNDCGVRGKGKVGIRGEVKFNGMEDKTFYDVSAIDNLTDNTGIKFLYPSSGTGVRHGCNKFPCNNAYNHAQDIQTQVTLEKDLICEIGG